jgi:hypothetical protein
MRRYFVRQKVLLVAVLALAFACTRSAPKPDANYERASQIYQQLFAAQLDDAYGDPKMNEVEALLKKVDSASADAASAQTMLGAIQHGREELAKDRAARDRVTAAAAAPVKMPNIDPDKILAASKAAAGPADAGAPSDAYGPGASIAELNSSTGGCLVAYEPFTETGTGKTGTVYRLSSAPLCTKALPSFDGQAVLVTDGLIYRRLAASSLSPPVPIALPPGAPSSQQPIPPAPQPPGAPVAQQPRAQ